MQLSRIAPYQPPCTPPIGFIASNRATPSNTARPRTASTGAKPSVAPMGGGGRRPAIMSSTNCSPERARISARSGRSAGEVAGMRGMALSGCGPALLRRGARRGKNSSGHVAQCHPGRDPQRVAHVAGEVGAVERVKMQVLHALSDQVAAEFGGYGGGQEVVTVVADRLGEGIVEPGGDVRAAGGGEFARAGPVLDRQDAGNDRRIDPRRRAGIAEEQEGL